MVFSAHGTVEEGACTQGDAASAACGLPRHQVKPAHAPAKHTRRPIQPAPPGPTRPCVALKVYEGCRASHTGVHWSFASVNGSSSCMGFLHPAPFPPLTRNHCHIRNPGRGHALGPNAACCRALRNLHHHTLLQPPEGQTITSCCFHASSRRRPNLVLAEGLALNVSQKIPIKSSAVQCSGGAAPRKGHRFVHASSMALCAC